MILRYVFMRMVLDFARPSLHIYNNDFQLNNAMFYIELRGYGFIVNSPRLNLRVTFSVGRPNPCTDKKRKSNFPHI
jgi:hypothetical protein